MWLIFLRIRLVLIFFFFWETDQNRPCYFIANKSKRKCLRISEGTDSFQIETRKDNLALWAKAWAKPLLCLPVWAKEKYCKELAKEIMSLTKWPTTGWWKHWFLIAGIEVSESPSKIELSKPSSCRKETALRAAIVSRARIDDGRGMISDRAASSSPKELLI